MHKGADHVQFLPWGEEGCLDLVNIVHERLYQVLCGVKVVDHADGSSQVPVVLFFRENGNRLLLDVELVFDAVGRPFRVGKGQGSGFVADLSRWRRLRRGSSAASVGSVTLPPGCRHMLRWTAVYHDASLGQCRWLSSWLGGESVR